MEHVLRSPDQLIWMAEFNSVCIDTLQQRIGPNDVIWESTKSFLHKSPEFLTQLKEGVFDASLMLPPDTTGRPMDYMFNGVRGVIPGLPFFSAPFKQVIGYIPPCTCISPTELELLTKSSILEHVDLSYFCFPEIGCKILSEQCPNITSINLYHSSVNDAGLKYLSEGCHWIQIINLQFCCSVTDIGLKYLCEGCHNIQKINLASCIISDDGLKLLSEECHDIQDINLFGCFVTDKGLKYLSEGCHKIQNIKINQMYGNEPCITDAGMKCIAEGCYNIQTIDISGCRDVTDMGVKYLLERCPNIKIIRNN